MSTVLCSYQGRVTPHCPNRATVTVKVPDPHNAATPDEFRVCRPCAAHYQGTRAGAA